MQYKRYLTESDVTSVSERSDDEARSIAQVLVVVAELSVTDVGETVVHLYIPPTNNKCDAFKVDMHYPKQLVQN